MNVRFHDIPKTKEYLNQLRIAFLSIYATM
jgi:hypothetical protein